MRLVGLEAPGPKIRVVLVGRDSELSRSTPPWIGGLAFGADGTIVLFPDRAPTYPDGSLEELLHHEVAHVLIARAAGGRPVPRWFHEGLAMVAERTWGLEDRARATVAVVGGARVGLDELDELFGRDRASRTRAYALSGALVRDMLQQHGPTTAAGTLAGIASGLDFDDAFARATGLPLRLAEEAFWRRTVWTHWIPILTSTVVLWIGITFLALVAIRRQRRRRAELRQRWHEEEEIAAALARADADADEPPETIH